MQSFKDLNVWKKSFELVQEIYEITKQLPDHERFGLSSQMQRSAISIPSNISEGQQRSGQKEFANFLSIARGSAAELYTQLLLCAKLYEVDCEKALALTEEIQKMLYSLQDKITKKTI